MEEDKPLLLDTDYSSRSSEREPLYPDLQPPQFGYPPVQQYPQFQSSDASQPSLAQQLQPQQEQVQQVQPPYNPFFTPPPFQSCPLCQMVVPIDQFQQHYAYCCSLRQQWMQQQQQQFQQQPVMLQPPTMQQPQQPTIIINDTTNKPPPVNSGYPGGMGNSSLNQGNTVSSKTVSIVSPNGKPYKQTTITVTVPPNSMQPPIKKVYSNTAALPTKKFKILLQTGCITMNGVTPLIGNMNISEQHVNFVAATNSDTIVITMPWSTIKDIKLVNNTIQIHTNDKYVRTFFNFPGPTLKKAYATLTKLHAQKS